MLWIRIPAPKKLRENNNVHIYTCAYRHTFISIINIWWIYAHSRQKHDNNSEENNPSFERKKKNYVHEIKDDSAWNISWNTLPFSLTFSAFLMGGRRVSLCELMLTERFRLVIVGSD